MVNDRFGEWTGQLEEGEAETLTIPSPQVHFLKPRYLESFCSGAYVWGCSSHGNESGKIGRKAHTEKIVLWPGWCITCPLLSSKLTSWGRKSLAG